MLYTSCPKKIRRVSTSTELEIKEESEVPRKGNVPKREVLPDPVYDSVVVAKLINSIMLDGKKGTAQKIVYNAFDQIRETTGEEPMEVFEKAMNNIMPVLEVKARRVGGANYQVPMPVREERRQTLALRWLTQYTRARGEKTMSERLAKELMDAVGEKLSTLPPVKAYEAQPVSQEEWIRKVSNRQEFDDKLLRNGKMFDYSNGCIEDPRLFYFENQLYLTVACRAFSSPAKSWPRATSSASALMSVATTSAPGTLSATLHAMQPEPVQRSSTFTFSAA